MARQCENNESVQSNAAPPAAASDDAVAQGDAIDRERYDQLLKLAMSLNHDINNPLTSIMGNADLIMLTEKGNLSDNARKKLESIIGEAKRICRILETFSEMKKSIIG